ncbi:MAG: hypothetical protein U1F36_15445 [Planctomycetota bacterium]
MTLKSRRGRALATLGIAAAILSLWCWPDSEVDPVEAEDGPPQRIETTAGNSAVERVTPADGAAPARSLVASPTPAAPADFDEFVKRLVDLGLELVGVVERREEGRARALDTQARRILVEIANAFPDSGEKSLSRSAVLPPIDATIEQTVRRQVLQRLLADDLDRRFTLSEKGGPRAGLDSLVDGMLRLVPKDAAVAEMLGANLIVGQPYLGPAHEEGVLHVLEESREQPWLERVACDLLRTLWRNLEKTGARTRADLASLALLFFDDPSAARRNAALHELLREPRLRHLVIDRALRSGDPEFAAQVGTAAATELDPTTALDVVRQLRGVGGSRMLAASVTIGTKAPERVRRAYEEALGDGREPGFRADLLIAGTLTNDADSLELARIAMREDPDPMVKNRALMALTGCPDGNVGEGALSAWLDDPRLGSDPTAVQGAVDGLENLAVIGDANAALRIGRRLLDHPLLGSADKARVREILARLGVSDGR